MKKFLLFLLIALFAVSLCLAACNPETPDDPNLPDNPDTPSGEELKGEYAKDMDIKANPNDFTDDYTLERGANERQLVLYWRESEHDYEDNDVWVWWEGKDGELYEYHECSYGAKIIVNVPSNISRVGFVLRADSFEHSGSSWGDCTKVYADDRYATLTGEVTEVYLTGRNAYQFTSSDQGKTLKMIRVISKMAISTLRNITYTVAPDITLTSMDDITVKNSAGETVEIESLTQLNKTEPYGTIVMKNDLDLSKSYTVTIKNYGDKVALPMEVFDSADFKSNYIYDGNDLGAVVSDNSTTFKVWAPTASKVVLNLYDSGNGGSATKVNMTRGDKGVWSSVQNVGHGKYYTYSVTTAAGEQEAVDPYARSAGVNGERGMVVDLARTNPAGFDAESYVTLNSYTEAVIWETHVRDFSNNIASSNYKGKYLAFTETGLTNSNGIPVGVDYVKNLGITHIHLMPVFDFKSVDEKSGAQFNWGYDPQNYNVPEGSYSTDPYNGEVRVREFKQMVQVLHAQGLGVIMDVVYNHTYDANSNLNKIVPNYYYRYNSDGTPSNGSGCGNDTASERDMFGKYMVDSVTYWMKEYKLDGFRFDLMGLHDVKTMQAIEKAVHDINPDAIIYGEGWTMTTAANGVLATQANIKRITQTEGAAGGIAVFNDVLRDGLRGSVFEAEEAGYLGKPSVNKPAVEFGLLGGEKVVAGAGATWTVNNGGVINYISAHDNNTLWDKLAISCPTASKEERLAMNKMGAAIVMLAKGTPFMQSGEEMLRTKKNTDGTFNDNSYNASDALNNLKWESLTAESNEYKTMQYYKGLIAMRKSSKTLTANSGVTITVEKLSTNQIVVTFNGEDGIVVAVINPTAEAFGYELPQGEWSLVANGEQAGATELAQASGEVSVAARSVNVYFSK